MPISLIATILPVDVGQATRSGSGGSESLCPYLVPLWKSSRIKEQPNHHWKRNHSIGSRMVFWILIVAIEGT